jgi:glucosamine--fructose-6-phosphate aminotransferase (isomerizing)
MCGIVGIVGSDPVAERLVAGLKRLEYRGYDSAGLAVIGAEGALERRRAAGKLDNLQTLMDQSPIDGVTGIAHTRWATHGKPNETNAHPHTVGPIAIIHNGIIENFSEIKAELEARGRTFETETDSETVAHLIAQGIDDGASMTEAFQAALKRLRGAYAIVAVCELEPDRLWAARSGSPLVVGIGDGEAFLGSDAIALAGWTRHVIYLEEGDWVVAGPDGARVFDVDGREVAREVHISNAVAGFADKGEYRHFMEKEIHEQPDAVSHTLSGFVDASERRFLSSTVHDWAGTGRLLTSACGTAFYALSVAKYWFEGLARLPVEADIASEFRYRSPVITPSDAALFVSQSGETADTLAALRHCRAEGAATLGVVNVQGSTIAREVDTALFTQAGPEIGVASTKAFTAQLAALASLAAGAARARGRLDDAGEAELAGALLEAPRRINEALALEPRIEALAHQLVQARDVLYLGRGEFFPLALEGALKLKEISYIHAEGYAAGELKHGPIALIEEGSPVVVIAPHNALFEKTVSSMQEVAARGARVILITDEVGAQAVGSSSADTLVLPRCHDFIQPIVAAVPLQLLAYHVAALKGTDVDQPRNLAKSVTVE